MTTTVIRDALYYPYIHLHDVNWLKGTLLRFPQLRRMVPPDFILNDSPEVRKFREVAVGAGNARRSLLTEESTENEIVYQAQRILKAKMEKAEEEESDSLRQLSHEVTITEGKGQDNVFQIHEGKVGCVSQIVSLCSQIEDLGIVSRDHLNRLTKIVA